MTFTATNLQHDKRKNAHWHVDRHNYDAALREVLRADYRNERAETNRLNMHTSVDAPVADYQPVAKCGSMSTWGDSEECRDRQPQHNDSPGRYAQHRLREDFKIKIQNMNYLLSNEQPHRHYGRQLQLNGNAT